MQWAWDTTTTWNTFSSWIGQGSRQLDPIQWLGSVWNHRFPLPPEPDVSWQYQYYHRSLVGFSGPTSWLSTFWECQGTVQHNQLNALRRYTLAKLYSRISTWNSWTQQRKSTMDNCWLWYMVLGCMPPHSRDDIQPWLHQGIWLCALLRI